MHSWAIVLNLVALLVAATMVLETLRAQPMWLRPHKSASPRQRRWLGLGLVLVTTGSLLLVVDVGGGVAPVLLPIALPFAGLVLFVVALVKGPTEAERARRARLLGRDSG